MLLLPSVLYNQPTIVLFVKHNTWNLWWASIARDMWWWHRYHRVAPSTMAVQVATRVFGYNQVGETHRHMGAQSVHLQEDPRYITGSYPEKKQTSHTSHTREGAGSIFSGRADLFLMFTQAEDGNDASSRRGSRPVYRTAGCGNLTYIRMPHPRTSRSSRSGSCCS